MLSRNTEWRQGAILTHEASLKLNLESEYEKKYTIIISHDCDLQNEKEDEVELIVGTKIDVPNHAFARARNVRSLHLVYLDIDQKEVWIELKHSGYKRIKKELFSNIATLDANLILPPDEKRSLKQWLAARHGRPAYPNEFEKRLQKNKKLYEKLDKLLKPINQYLVGIFFDLNGDRETELSHGSPYYLTISLVYDGINGQIAREAVNDSCSEIIILFHKIFGTPDIASEIVLEKCTAIADTIFSLADMRKMDQWWRYDYLSLAESPISPYIPIGAVAF